MQNKQGWYPTKFIKKGGRYCSTRDTQYVSLGSRFIVNVLSEVYEAMLKKHASGRLLDLGCGNVPLYEMYRNYVTDNMCIDWSNSLHENPFIDDEFDLNEPVPFESEQFDTILCTDVMEHIAHPANLMREIARLLCPKGKLLLSVPFMYWLHEEPYDYFRYTEYALTNYCKQNNLTILELESFGGICEIIADLTAKTIMIRFGHKPRLSKLMSAVHLMVSQWLCWIGRGLSARTRKKMPLGYYLVAQK